MTRKSHRVVASVEALRSEEVGTVKGTSLANAVAAASVPPANVDDSIPSGGLPAALKAGPVTAIGAKGRALGRGMNAAPDGAAIVRDAFDA